MKRFLLASMLLLTFGVFGQTTQGISPTVVISEIMFNPPESGTDSLEYLEITNSGTSNVNLNGWKLTPPGVSFTFPNITIAPGQYIVICTDSLAFLNFYGFSAYRYTQALNNTPGDTLRLYDGFNNLQDFVAYRTTAPWPQGPPSPAGGGSSIELCNLSADNSLGSNWQVSTTPVGGIINSLQVYGTPGAGCSGTSGPIVVSATAINPTTVTVLFNTAVSTTAENVANYTGLGTVTTATRDVPQTTVTLTLAQPLVNGIQYTLTVDNVENLANVAMLQPQSFNFVFNNTIADVQITEIMYDNPGSDDYEFLELYNRGTTPAYVGGYKFTSGINITLQPDTIAPGGFLYLSANPSMADNFYNFDSYAYSGNLLNTGEHLQIENTVGDVIDSLTYSDSAPWSTDPSGNGSSLTLCNPQTDNSVAANWAASIIYIGNNGTGGIYATINLVGCTTGLNEAAADAGIKLAPNPVESELVLYNTNTKQYSIQIIDATGRLVMASNISTGANSFNTDGLATGLYIVRFNETNTNSTFALKFLKK